MRELRVHVLARRMGEPEVDQQVAIAALEHTGRLHLLAIGPIRTAGSRSRDEAAAKLQRAGDRMCGCADSACMLAVHAEISPWITELTYVMRPASDSESDRMAAMEDVRAITEPWARYGRCHDKLWQEYLRSRP